MSINNTNSQALVGLQWGDEGKGKIIDWVASDAKHVARFQGGHNAGHTVVAEGKEFALHLIPSGILREHCSCYIGQGVVLSIPALLEEIQMLKDNGIECKGRLFVSGSCSLVMEHHVKLDQAREKSKGSIGTTLRGIGPSHEDKQARCAVRLGDVIGDKFIDKLTESVSRINCQLEHLHNEPVCDVEKTAKDLKEQAKQLVPYLSDITWMLEEARRNNEKILLEGSQGALLDIEQGGYPFVTSASCIASAAVPGLGIDLKPEVIGIAKAYATRVGNGAFPTEMQGEQSDWLTEKGNEYGATTARRRRVGWLDIPALRHALNINGCSKIAITKIDTLADMATIKVCVGYTINGVEIDRFSPNNHVLENCEPKYIEVEGWEAIDTAESFSDIPQKCQDYINMIEKLCEIKVSIISFGPEREKTMFRD